METPAIYAVHQPHYLPWLRYLHKAAGADVFVLLDDAQYTKNGWQNRTRIKGPDGPVMLTVPVHARLGDPIREVRPAEGRWVRRHLASLEACYGSLLGRWRAGLAALLDHPADRSLGQLGEATVRFLMEAFDIRTPLVRSSELDAGGHGSERLAGIGRALGATTYLTGAHAMEAYLDPAPFARAGIEIVSQAWNCPRYDQRFAGAGFVPDLSGIDLLLAEGDRASEILMRGGSIRRDPPFAA